MQKIIGLSIHDEDEFFQTTCQVNAFLTRKSKVTANTFLSIVRNKINIRYSNLYIQPPEDVLPKNLLDLIALHKADFINFLLSKGVGSISNYFQDTVKQFNYYIWKTSLISKSANNILVLGCGKGYELAFLRFAAPYATITAIEFKQNVDIEVLKKLDIVFLQYDAKKFLDEKLETYDLIFSNHVLEHFGNPDALMKLIFEILREGGSMVAALPLDLDHTTPYSDKLGALCSNPETISLLDAAYLDIGHSWKATYQDVGSTLMNAGYGEIKLILRNFSYENIGETFEQYVMSKKRFGLIFNYLLIDLPRKIMKVIFGKKIPRKVHQLFVYLDLNLWFGSNTLKSALAPELLVIAVKNELSNNKT